jgi:hypothetical protein
LVPNGDGYGSVSDEVIDLLLPCGTSARGRGRAQQETKDQKTYEAAPHLSS